MIRWQEWTINDQPLAEWLRENYAHLTNREIADLFERAFGERPSSAALRKQARELGVRKRAETLARTNRQGRRGRGVPREARVSQVSTETKREYHGIQAETVLQALRDGPKTLRELSDALDRGESTVLAVVEAMVAEGYGLEREEQHLALPEKPPLPPPPPTLADEKCQRIAFGAIADIHGGSKYTQWTNLKAFAREAVEEHGVSHVLVSGDIVAGNGRVYRGQMQDLYAFGSDEQVEDVAHNLPQVENLAWILEGGNHDYSFFKDEGTDIVRRIADQRDDVLYVGFDAVDVPLTQRVDARLWHPSGGVPYAISYRGQKYAAQIAFEELLAVVLGEKAAGPSIRFILIGHLHIIGYFEQGPLQVFQVGCFEAQNSYLKRKGVTPSIGGWVLEAELTEKGLVRRLAMHRLSYVPIDDDYRHHYVPLMAKRAKVTIEPLFRLEEGDSP